MCREKSISEYTRHMLIDMSKKVLGNLARKYQNVTKGVKKVMGGKILEYEAKTIRNEGISQGRIAAYVEMLNAGNITLKEAAERLDMSEADLNAYRESE